MAKSKQPVITVDDHFVRVDGKSYAIDKITSVEVREEPAPPKGCAAAMVIFGAIGMLGALAFAPLLIFAIPMMAIGIVVLRKAKTSNFQLFIVTSAAEQQALSTHDGELIADLRKRIEGAISSARQRQ